MKRLLDCLIATIALLILLPVSIVVASLIVITSPGNPFFGQSRVGQHGKLFTLYKFRSMRKSKRIKNPQFDPGDSTRVTWFGAIIRKLKIDELPQLWNVIRGDMSLVGPRPEVPMWTELYPEKWEIILTVRPGITDPASIAFRNEEDLLKSVDDPAAFYQNVILPKKLELSCAYVARQSIGGDVTILFKTLLTIIKSGTGNSLVITRESEI